jgi:precorrin-4/cobalt-precorrin-4 C11-methyltransferase
MVHFVGAGPGGPDLITLRGAELLGRADCVVYAGSLVNPALLGLVREGVPVYNSAQMTLEQVLEVLEETHRRGEIPSASTPGIPASMGPSGSRWTPWTPGTFPGM